MKKRISSFTGLKKGTKLKVVSNFNGHNYKIGETYTLAVDVKGINVIYLTGGYFENYPQGNTIGIHEVEVVGGNTLKELQEERLELLKQVVDLEEKIAFCNENRLEKFDDEIFKILDILNTIEDKKLSKIQKATKILSELNK